MHIYRYILNRPYCERFLNQPFSGASDFASKISFHVKRFEKPTFESFNVKDMCLQTVPITLLTLIKELHIL